MFLILRGGGFGWLAVRIFGDAIPSADLFYSNITFTSALQKPHDGIKPDLSLICSIISYYFYISEQKNYYAYISIVSLVILMFFYPYYIISYALIVGVYTLRQSYIHKTLYPSTYFIIGMILAGITAVNSYFSIIQSGFSHGHG